MHEHRNIFSSVVFAIAFTLIITGVISDKSVTSVLAFEKSGVNSGDDVALHLSKVRGIELEEAKKLAEWQDRADFLNDQLMELLPVDDFGGVWIDGDTDRVKVGVLNGSRPNGVNWGILSQKVSESELKEAVDFVPVEHPFYQLKEVKEGLNQRFGELAESLITPIQLGIGTDTNQIFVHIPRDADRLSGQQSKLIESIKAEYGNMLRFTTYESVPEAQACNFWYCNNPLRGGVGIKGDRFSANYNHGIDCTAGFNVVGNSGTKYALTAGHCGSSGSGWATETTSFSTARIGPIHRNVMDQNKPDAMIIRIREDVYNWTVRGWVYVRNGQGWNGFHGPSYNEEYDINGRDTSGGLIGSRICISGALMGSSCGAVHEVDISITFNDGIRRSDIVRAGYCTAQSGGDSGAPIFRIGKALGIHTGASNPSTECSNQKYYTGIRPIIQAMDNTIEVF